MRVHMMHVQCIYLWSNLTLMHVCMMHMSLMRMNACIHVWCINLWCRVFSLQTNGQINKPIIGVHCDVCVYDAYIYDLWSLILTNVCMMQNVLCIYPLLDVACMNDACMYLYCAFSKVCEPCMYDACIYHLRPLTLVHVRFMRICMMHVHLWSWSLILMHACKYDACIYDAANFVPDERTNQPTDKAILGVGCLVSECETQEFEDFSERSQNNGKNVFFLKWEVMIWRLTGWSAKRGMESSSKGTWLA